MGYESPDTTALSYRTENKHPPIFNGELYEMEDGISVKLNPGSQEHYASMKDDEDPLDYQGLFQRYAAKLYFRKQEKIARFITAKENLKL